MHLSQKQLETKTKIERYANDLGIDPSWALAIAMTESSLGIYQHSPTNCLGVFQMSSIAMKDLLMSMDKNDDDLVDIFCGIAFLRLLLRRWHTIEDATSHFCDPNDRHFYVDRVKDYISSFKNWTNDQVCPNSEQINERES